MLPYCTDEWENRLAILATAGLMLGGAMACVAVVAGSVVVSWWCITHW